MLTRIVLSLVASSDGGQCHQRRHRPLIHMLHHKDVSILIDCVRLRGLRRELINDLRKDANVASRVLSDPLRKLLVNILILHNNTKAISHPKSHTAHMLERKKC
jgi:hypothetical protein